ncbi:MULTISPECIES: DsbA family oxidoreductase [Chryseobacterium]|uniref:DsbA family dithiol-disulfide isomerase n=1 Tax=Chryseobacterium camelliae TaxID=1265445 RepID=A0ABU0TJ01_9FLAO|nr:MULTISPECIES: DsbA family oxidoreductase [Chryseobacterium]MDT3405951.1 putative DsbA family dithiol-disulfide isomerase [Pseudacidovorax intermedius]MDQ1096245.1 putative DsbA family dithiol-disulfide isomerase [Chryseobacterium camelliae]MDQ1100182.1 putative DsbA family dithiol-disulfide isomerase [Chryseobacterium sp. SORGH_AS_1048]MDR6087526.1 putative DsbA family dithiol-disulfide isomerase [Chryseobacterium sp. SORGH_AS_0909]MDR6131901.1 putative DsbA family dithiol-disulfide isomera
MKIEIWSDVMCPFCYIGKKNFEAALEKLPFRDEVDVEWKSFQLDRTLDPAKTISTLDYFKQKKGFAEAQAEQMISQVTQAGKNAGIDFNFNDVQITNTYPAHRLLHLSKKYHCSSETEEALFSAHFTEGKNVADTEVLLSIASSVGIDRDEAKIAVTSHQFDEQIDQDLMEAEHHNVRGVPFFILDGKYAVSGAQPTALFEDALQQTYEETGSGSPSAQGGTCDTDECSM